MSSIHINYGSNIKRLLPVTFGITFMAIAWTSCSGVALTFIFIYYIVLLANAYKQATKRWEIQIEQNQQKQQVQEQEQKQEEQQEQLQLRKTEEVNAYNESTITSFEKGNNYRSINYSQGLYNFSFHIIMLLLLLLMALLNFGITIAWIKSTKDWTYAIDSDQLPSFAVLLCLSILLQLVVPHKCSRRRLVAITLYFSAISCILYCQENIYLLKYIIAFVYILITVLEVSNFLSRIFHNRRLNILNK